MDEETNEVGGFSYSPMQMVENNNPFSAGLTFYTYGTRIITLSPDGKWIAFGGWDETIQTCEVIEGGKSFTYRGHKNDICAIEWSPDGKWIVSASNAEATTDIQVWEATTGRVVSLFQNDEEWVNALAWSPDSLKIAFGSGKSAVHLLDAITGDAVFTYQEHTTHIAAVAWSPDGTHIASGGLDGSVRVWNVSDGTNICRYLGHFGGVNALAWSPDGTRIASGGDDKTVQVWDANTREPICTHPHHNARVMAVGWTRDGRHVRSGAWDGIIREFDARSGEYVTSFSFPFHTSHMAMPLVWNLDATTFAMGLEDHRVAVADMVEGKLWLCRAPSKPVELSGSANKDQQIRTHTAIHYDQPIKIWGGKEREAVIYRGHTGAVKALSWSADKNVIASGGYDNTIQIWDATNGKWHATFRGHLDPVVTLAWSPDGQKLLSGSLDTVVRIWDFTTGQSITEYHGHNAAISSVAWAPFSASNAPRIASGSMDGTIKIWDMEKTVYLIYHGHNSPITTLAWSPDGRFIVSGAEDTTVQVWDVITGDVICTYNGLAGEIMCVAWSPDGKRIAASGDWGQISETSGRDDTPKVHLWDALTGNNPVFCDDDPHYARIPALAWSPDNRFVVTGDIFGHILVYNATTGKTIARMFARIAEYQQAGTALALVWAHDGQHIAASFQGGLVYVWPTQ